MVSMTVDPKLARRPVEPCSLSRSAHRHQPAHVHFDRAATVTFLLRICYPSLRQLTNLSTFRCLKPCLPRRCCQRLDQLPRIVAAGPSTSCLSTRAMTSGGAPTALASEPCHLSTWLRGAALCARGCAALACRCRRKPRATGTTCCCSLLRPSRCSRRWPNA